MAYTATANRAYKDPVTTVWANDLKNNDDALYTGVAKSWIAFDASGVGSAIATKNITSVVRVNAGIYTVTFSTGFATTNICVLGGCRASSTQDGYVHVEGTAGSMNTSSVTLRVKNSSDVVVDVSQVYAGFWGAN